MKLALAMIVRGTDAEADNLTTALNNVSPYVDGIFITSTYLPGKEPNQRVESVAKAFGAEVSPF
jgi:hypothetical protein